MTDKYLNLKEALFKITNRKEQAHLEILALQQEKRELNDKARDLRAQIAKEKAAEKRARSSSKRLSRKLPSSKR